MTKKRETGDSSERRSMSTNNRVAGIKKTETTNGRHGDGGREQRSLREEQTRD